MYPIAYSTRLEEIERRLAAIEKAVRDLLKALEEHYRGGDNAHS